MKLHVCMYIVMYYSVIVTFPRDRAVGRCLTAGLPGFKFDKLIIGGTTFGPVVARTGAQALQNWACRRFPFRRRQLSIWGESAAVSPSFLSAYRTDCFKFPSWKRNSKIHSILKENWTLNTFLILPKVNKRKLRKGLFKCCDTEKFQLHTKKGEVLD